MEELLALNPSILQHFEVPAPVIYSDPLGFGGVARDDLARLWQAGRWDGWVLAGSLGYPHSKMLRWQSHEWVLSENQGSHECGFHGPRKSALDGGWNKQCMCVESRKYIVFLTLSKYVFRPASQFVFLKVFFPIKREVKNFYAGWEAGYLRIISSPALQKWSGTRLVCLSCSVSVGAMDCTLEVLSSSIECFAQVRLGTSVQPISRGTNRAKSKSLLKRGLQFVRHGCDGFMKRLLLTWSSCSEHEYFLTWWVSTLEWIGEAF